MKTEYISILVNVVIPGGQIKIVRKGGIFRTLLGYQLPTEIKWELESDDGNEKMQLAGGKCGSGQHKYFSRNYEGMPEVAGITTYPLIGEFKKPILNFIKAMGAKGYELIQQLPQELLRVDYLNIYLEHTQYYDQISTADGRHWKDVIGLRNTIDTMQGPMICPCTIDESDVSLRVSALSEHIMFKYIYAI